MESGPDGTIVEIAGHDLVHTLAKTCPQCRQTFWTYQEMGKERQPYLQDPEPDPAQTRCGAREVCDSPVCLDREQEHQMRRRMAFRLQSSAPAAPAPGTKTKLVRGGRANQQLLPLGATS